MSRLRSARGVPIRAPRFPEFLPTAPATLGLLAVITTIGFGQDTDLRDAGPLPPTEATQGTGEEIEALRREIEQLRRQVESLEKEHQEVRLEEVVNLDEEEVDYGQLGTPSHVLARPWYQNITVSGFGAFNFLATGQDALWDDGGFLIKEASLFVNAAVWEDISVFVEIQTNRLGKDDDLFVRTGEVYGHFRDLLNHWDDDLLSVKVGRIDIPFGEEYLWMDSSDNPLITSSAPFVYGWDEGILFYGAAREVGWIVAVTDGTDDRSLDDNLDKAVNVKVYGNPLSALYLSGSFMRTGKSEKSGLEFGGSHLRPVGDSFDSSLGASSSRKVEALLYELDAKYSFGDAGYLAFSFGQSFVDDKDSSFDRDFLWFSVEALYSITPEFYAIARYSEIGTYKSSEGYAFDGKIVAGGNDAFGYDTRRFQRLSLGVGWKPVPPVLLKVEIGSDRFEVIDASTFETSDSDRWLLGAEVVLTF